MQHDMPASPADTHVASVGERLIMLFGGALSSLALVGINSVLPAIDAALSHGAGDSLLVKQLVGMVGMAMMVGSILAGLLIERVSIRPLLLASALVYVIAGCGGLYLADLRAILASRILVGLSSAVIQISALTLIAGRLGGTARARWMGLHISVAMICTIVIQPIAGLLGDYSWRAPFGLYALGLLVFAVLLVEGDIRGDAGAGAAGPRRPPGGKGSWRDLPYAYIPFAILIGSIVFLPAIYVPFLLRDRGLTAPSAIALVLTADSVAGALMASQFGRARAVLTRHGAFATSFAIAAVGTAVAALSGNIVGLIGGLLFYGFGVGWLVPNLMTSIGEKVRPELQARALGLVKAAHFSSSGVALLVMEPVTRRFGIQAGLLVVAATAGLLLVVALLRTIGRPAGLTIAPLDAPGPRAGPDRTELEGRRT